MKEKEGTMCSFNCRKYLWFTEILEQYEYFGVSRKKFSYKPNCQARQIKMASAYLERCGALWKTIEMDFRCQEVYNSISITSTWENSRKL